MVGEIRDQETAQIAINSALTGHLVFTTGRTRHSAADESRDECPPPSMLRYNRRRDCIQQRLVRVMRARVVNTRWPVNAELMAIWAGLLVADFAHHDLVRVVAQNRPQPAANVNPFFSFTGICVIP